jgi:hypothetical protein
VEGGLLLKTLLLAYSRVRQGVEQGMSDIYSLPFRAVLVAHSIVRTVLGSTVRAQSGLNGPRSCPEQATERRYARRSSAFHRFGRLYWRHSALLRYLQNTVMHCVHTFFCVFCITLESGSFSYVLWQRAS